MTSLPRPFSCGVRVRGDRKSEDRDGDDRCGLVLGLPSTVSGMSGPVPPSTLYLGLPCSHSVGRVGRRTLISSVIHRLSCLKKTFSVLLCIKSKTLTVCQRQDIRRKS